MTPKFFTSIFAPAALLFAPPAADAVQIKGDAIPNRALFGVELAGTDSQFFARADRVLSVSWQEYATGTYIVSEVVIDIAESCQQIRIYSLRPPGAVETLDAAGGVVSAASPAGGATPAVSRAIPDPVLVAEGRAGDAVGKASAQMPVKVYPTTTHAKTVEYVVGSRAELLSFYKNFRDLICRKERAPGTGGEGGANQLGGTIFRIQP